MAYSRVNFTLTSLYWLATLSSHLLPTTISAQQTLITHVAVLQELLDWPRRWKQFNSSKCWKYLPIDTASRLRRFECCVSKLLPDPLCSSTAHFAVLTYISFKTFAATWFNIVFSGAQFLPEDGDGASPRNVVFKRIDAAVRPRKLYWVLTYVCCWIAVMSEMWCRYKWLQRLDCRSCGGSKRCSVLTLLLRSSRFHFHMPSSLI